MTTATHVLETIQRDASSTKTRKARTPGAMAPGDWYPQGDVNVFCVGSVPKNATLVEKPSRQVAPGETRGARHCIRDLSAVTVYALHSPNELQGPIIKAPDGFVMDHGDGADDDHATVEFGPGVYTIGYQRRYADELSRQLD